MTYSEHTDGHELVPTTHEIRETFADAIAEFGGEVRDEFDDGSRLILRAVLPQTDDVLPGDVVRGGVALRAAGPEILVHPYTFREVCTNGAIRAHALDTRRVERPAPQTWQAGAATEEALVALRTAVYACASPEAFRQGVQEMRSAADAEADHVLMLLPFLAHVARAERASVVTSILGRFERQPDPDRSAFGLMNAVTSVARDTRDPALRWRLEVIGAAIAARARAGVSSVRATELVGA